MKPAPSKTEQLVSPYDSESKNLSSKKLRFLSKTHPEIQGKVKINIFGYHSDGATLGHPTPPAPSKSDNTVSLHDQKTTGTFFLTPPEKKKDETFEIKSALKL